MVFWKSVLVLHLLAMTFFVGGQLFLAAVIVPVNRAMPDPERLRAVARRFGEGTIAAIAIAVITGTMLASHENRWSDFALQLKLGFVVLVGVLIWWHMKRPGNHVLEGAIFVVSLIIVWLGVTLVLD